MDLDTLTPGQAARQVLAALETLRVENETLAADKACLAAANDALTEERASLAGENEAQAERIRRLEHLNLELIRLLYGKRSEKLSADERQLAFEELEGASAEVEAAGPPEDPA
ncbi:MAG: transposase, partial [Alphaproteobacteria bacterium]|nr:transposase [Alphaproteobacteria bacterium]